MKLGEADVKTDVFIANVMEDLAMCSRKYKGDTFSRWDVEGALWKAMRTLNGARNSGHWFSDKQGTFVRNVLTALALDSGRGMVAGYSKQDVKKAVRKMIKIESVRNGKPLEELNEEEFNTLKATGLLWEIFPDSPDTFHGLQEYKKRRESANE
jgi:hypothetical protein